MKSLIMMAAAAAMITTGAHAADMARPVYKAQQTVVMQTYNWGGFYAGINGGWGNSQENISMFGTDPIADIVVGTGAVQREFRPGTQGWVFGGQVGYNWQFGKAVVGGEADFQWSGIKGDDSHLLTTRPLGFPADLRSQASTSLDWFGTVTARAGWLATDTILIYAKGGLAYGKVAHEASASLSTPFPAITYNGSGSAGGTKAGWTAGAGVEMALTDRLRARLEYSYIDLGSSGVNFSDTVLGTKVGFGSNVDYTYHMVRGGVSMAF